MWIGSLTLLLTLAFEYLRKWLIDEINMPPFPFVVFIVALVPVVMLAIKLVTMSRLPTLDAADIRGLLGTPTREVETVERLALSGT